MPNRKNLITIFFENFLPYFRTKIDAHILWLVYAPERIISPNKKITGESILDIHDYRDASDVIEREKPDLIFASPDWNFIDYAFSAAAKLYNIPVFFMTTNLTPQLNKGRNTTSFSTSFVRFFESTVLTDTENNKKQIFRRGRFFLKKYWFLVKTQTRLNNEIFLTLFGIWKFILTGKNYYRFGSDIIQFIENKHTRELMIKDGFNKSNLIISGNPIYDSFFKTCKFNEQSSKISYNILFTPSTASEHGYWTSDQRNMTFTQIVKEISKQRKFNLTIKIHPSSSIIDDYYSILKKIDSKVPIFQQGSIIEYLEDMDVIITSPFSSSAETYALLAKKRIVICNFFDQDYEDPMVENGVAISCRTPSMLCDSIEKALDLQLYEQNREKFIENFLFKWDGNSSKRITEKLLDILQKNKSEF